MESLRVRKCRRRKVVGGSKEGVTCLKTKEQFKMSDSYDGGIDFG